MPEKSSTMHRLQRINSSEGWMRKVQRASIDEEYEVSAEMPIPPVPEGGARIRVCFVGACYTEKEVNHSRRRRPRLPGIHDTSLFPGIEISGIVDDLCNTVANSDRDLQLGDHVVVYADKSEDLSEAGYAEYIVVKNVDNLVKVPSSVPLEVAAILPGGALNAYSAVSRALAFIEHKASINKGSHVNVLIVGAGGLGLWTVIIARHLLSALGERLRIIVADNCLDKLELAKQHGCYDTVHWHDGIQEEYIVERTQNTCQGGLELVIDFVSSTRTVSRVTSLLNEGGILVAGGNSKQDVSISLNSLTRNHQCVMGVPQGSKEQLVTLVKLIADGQVVPPCYYVFPVEEANIVFRRLSQCQINGRAVLRISESDSTDSNTPSPPTEGRPVFM
eukprot:GHVU01026903.1.p1 GENE.GHVU01026903.1~~GHVU01026903.1.p1  ORF type:complete len:390 (+),score=15.06 GHVU01026903.1:239-1408(+)